MPAPSTSGTPLARKLGYRTGMTAHVVDAPEEYRTLVSPLPDGVHFEERPGAGSVDLLHAFLTERSRLEALLPVFRALIRPAGMIWISWPKKRSGVPADVDGDAVRAAAFPLDLVDVKVCAVDTTWTALKLMVRRERRQNSVR